MSKPQASGPGSDVESGSNTKTDTQPKDGCDESKAMEEAQQDAAEERATEGGYQ
jgi:hypothetical protein